MATYNAGYKDGDLIHVRKSMTYSNAAGSGAIGTVTLFTTTGAIVIELMSARCTSDLTTSGAATIQLGVTGTANLIIDATTATSIDNGTIWNDTSPNTNAGELAVIGATIHPAIIRADIINTIGTANITGGTIVYDIWYRPVSADGALVAA